MRLEKNRFESKEAKKIRYGLFALLIAVFIAAANNASAEKIIGFEEIRYGGELVFNSSSFNFFTDNISRLYFGSSGLIGIGTITPGAKLTVMGNVSLNNTLYVSESGRVGIGVSSPNNTLQVAGNITPSLNNTYALGSPSLWWRDLYLGNDSLYIGGTALSASASGVLMWNGTAISNVAVQTGDNIVLGDSVSEKVGIGTTTPSHKLEVAGAMNVTDLNVSNNLRVAGDLTVVGTSNLGSITISADNLTVNNVISRDGNISFFNSSGSEKMRIVGESGNVGIGTASPTTKLDVAGTINATMVNATIIYQGANQVLDASSTIGNTTAEIWGVVDNSTFARLTGFSGENITSGVVADARVVDDLTIASTKTINTTGGLNVTGGAYIGGMAVVSNLNVTGNAYLNSMTFEDGNITASLGTFTTLNVTGTSYLGDLTINADNITVNGIVSKDGNVTFYNATGGEKMRITEGGNVGIGTTSPTSKLHVSGLCVAENSLITMADGTKKKITEIKPNEYVQSLDEETGKIVSNKVKALLDMGNKTIYEMITETGRAINTTRNHPYLVNSNHKNSKSSGVSLITSPLSSSEEHCFNNLDILDFCISKSFGGTLNNQTPKCSAEVYGLSMKCLSRVINNLCSDKASLKTSPLSILLGHNLTSCPDSVRKRNKPLCTFSSNKNFILSRDKLKASFCELSSKFQGRFDMFFGEGRICFNDLSGSSPIFKHFQNYRDHDSCTFESRLSMADVAINNDVIINFSSHSEANKDNGIYKSFGEWIKVKELKVGDEIAVYDSETNKPIWEKIVEINQHKPQHVYDLMIENTHNFIANDIIAHNTYIDGTANITGGLNVTGGAYIGGNVGIGTTSPKTKLDILGNVSIKGDLAIALPGTINVSSGNTVINTSVDLTANISANDAIKISNGTTAYDEIFTVSAILAKNITLDSAPTYNMTDASVYKDSNLFLIEDGDGSDKVVVDKSGNVGIGTSTPSAKLDVAGTVNASAIKTITLNVTGITYFGTQAVTNIDASGNIVGEGNLTINGSVLFADGDSEVVGIGTAGPTTKLDVAGTINATMVNATIIYQGANQVLDASSTIGNTSAEIWGVVDNSTFARLTGFSGENITSGTVADARIASTIARDSELIGNCSGKDCDIGWGNLTSVPTNLDTDSTDDITTSGGTITGNLIINGNLTLIGDVFEVNVTQQNINGSVYPQLTNTFDIGSPGLIWNEIYATTFIGQIDWANLTNIGKIGNTTTEIRAQFTGSDNITISSGVISINKSFILSTDKIGNTSSEIWGVVDNSTFARLTGFSGENITSGSVADARVIDDLTIASTKTINTTGGLNVSGGAYIGGNVGIGNTNPSEKLNITGNAAVSQNFTMARGLKVWNNGTYWCFNQC